MKKTTIIIMALTLVSQILGFGREVTLSYYYGASNISDAYLISLLIPGLIIGIIASGISSAYIPIYNKVTITGGHNKGDIFTSQVINILLLICLALLLVSNIFIESIITIFAQGFSDDSLELTKKFTKVSLLAMFFIGLTPILSGYLHNNKNYTLPALVGIPFNIIIITSIFLSNRISIDFLATGFLIANIASILIMLFFIAKNKFYYKFSIGLSNKYTRKIYQLALPVILGASFNQINILIDRTIASGISVGGITALHYANRINLSIDSIITVSFMVIFFPVMSKLTAENKTTLFNSKVESYIIWISLLIIPISVLLILNSTEVITILFGRGAFDNKAITMTSGTLLFYSLGMIGVAISTILTKTCYALQNTTLPMRVLVFGIIVNISTSLILSRFIGLNGLALGTSFAAIIASIILFNLMKKQYSFLFEDFSLTRLIIKIFTIALLSGFLGKELATSLNINSIIYTLFFTMFFSAFIYSIAVHFGRIIDLKKVIKDIATYAK